MSDLKTPQGGKLGRRHPEDRPKEVYEVSLMDGKYKVRMSDDMKVFEALRYDEPWQNLCGNNLVYALVCKVQELEERLRGMVSSE